MDIMSDTEGLTYRELQAECKLRGIKADGDTDALRAKLAGEAPPEVPVDPEPEPVVAAIGPGREDAMVQCGENKVRIIPNQPHGIDIVDKDYTVLAQVRMRSRNEAHQWKPIEGAKRLAVLAAFAKDMFDSICDAKSDWDHKPHHELIRLQKDIESALREFGC